MDGQIALALRCPEVQSLWHYIERLIELKFRKYVEKGLVGLELGS